MTDNNVSSGLSFIEKLIIPILVTVIGGAILLFLEHNTNIFSGDETPSPDVISVATSTQDIPDATEETPVPIQTATLAIPTESPSPPPTQPDFDGWLIVIGQFPSLSSAQNYIVPFVNNGFTVKVFCRISPSDSTQTPMWRAAVIDLATEGDADSALPQVQTLNSAAYARQFSEWCPNPVQQADYVSCNYVSCP